MLHIPTFEEACAVLGLRPGDLGPGPADRVGMVGEGWFELRDERGELKELGAFRNLITDVGDQYYGERAAGISSPPNQVTGMKLGTGTTAVAKTGAGAAIVTYVTGITASKAIDSTWPQSSQPSGSGTARQIQWKTSWSSAEAIQNGLAEVVLSNQTSLADSAGSAANTIARALLSPTINKASGDTLAVTWNHNLFGA